MRRSSESPRGSLLRRSNASGCKGRILAKEGETGWARLKLPATLDSLESLRQFVLEHARAAGWAEDRLFNLQLALEEVLVNIIHYAYPDRGPGEVEVACRAPAPMELGVEVRDEGMPFDPLAQEAPDVHCPVEERPIGGLGIFLARQMADEIRYRREGNQNILTLRFRADSPKPVHG